MTTETTSSHFLLISSNTTYAAGFPTLARTSENALPELWSSGGSEYYTEDLATEKKLQDSQACHPSPWCSDRNQSLKSNLPQSISKQKRAKNLLRTPKSNLERILQLQVMCSQLYKPQQPSSLQHSRKRLVHLWFPSHAQVLWAALKSFNFPLLPVRVSSAVMRS